MDEPTPLSPGAVELLEALMAARLGEERAELPGTGQLVRYLAGELTPGAALVLERSLVSRPEAAAELLAVHEVFARLRRQSWKELTETARSPGLEGEVAESWTEILRSCARSPSEHPFRSSGWEALRAGLGVGAAGARAAWIELAGMLEQLRLELALPRVALVRGPESTVEVHGPVPEGLRARLVRSEVSPSHALEVEIRLVDERGRPSDAASGARVELALGVRQLWWPVASTLLAGSRLAWSLPELGRHLGAPPGPLPAGFVRLWFERPAAPAPGSSLPVLAPVTTGRGEPTGDPPVELEITLPVWEAGELALEVRVPEAVRSRFPGGRVRLELAITESAVQLLGEWPLADCRAGHLRAACPGVEPAPGLRAPLPRIRLIADGGSGRL